MLGRLQALQLEANLNDTRTCVNCKCERLKIDFAQTASICRRCTSIGIPEPEPSPLMEYLDSQARAGPLTPTADPDSFRDTPAFTGAVRQLPIETQSGGSAESDSASTDDKAGLEPRPDPVSLRELSGVLRSPKGMDDLSFRISKEVEQSRAGGSREMLRLRLEAKSAEVVRLKEQCAYYVDKCDLLEAEMHELKSAMWFAVGVCVVLIGTYLGEA